MANDYLRILSVDNPADAVKLARKAKRVKNPQSTEVIVGIQRMKRAATAWEHETGRKCEGLAAPQVGWNARVIIVRTSNAQEPKSPEDFTKAECQAIYGELLGKWPSGDTHDEYMESMAKIRAVSDKYNADVAAYRQWKYQTNGHFDPWMVLINPTILQAEGKRKATEGCLSVPNGGYEVERPTHVGFKFTSPNGKFSGSHLARFNDEDNSAQILMHEIEHLRGNTINLRGTPIVGAGSDKL